MTTRTKRNIRTMAVAVAAAFPMWALAANPMPWMDRSLSADQRATLVLKEMTQDEKLQWVFGYFGSDFSPKKTIKIPAALPASAGYIPGVARLGLPELFETDAGIGVATQATGKPRERTALPSGLASAATWNPQLAYAGGAMIGKEARASGFNVMLAGGVNLIRDPRNGRNFEYAGEDPLLAGVMVGHAVKGIQSNHLISTVKHFALNAQETGRFHLDAKIGESAARASDLLAMQLAIELGNPGSIMCAYNRYNGDYACENAWLLNQVLKQDWRYKGYVMSDWGAVHSTVKAANNGLDQQSGSEFDDKPFFGAPLKKAVAAGEVPQSRLDNMVYRILWAMFDKGVVDHAVKPDGAIDFAANGLVSRAGAEEGMVLLKNTAVLPLSKSVKKIVVIGGHADVGVLSGGGSSQVYPVGGNAVPGIKPTSWPGPVVYYPSSPLKAIRAQAPGASVSFDNGKDKARAARLAADADVAIVFATQWIGEANDATTLSLPDGQDGLIDAVAAANARTVVVLETSGPVTMPWVDKAAAILQAWYSGTSGGDAIGRVLFGEVNPSGHLPTTFPVSVDQLPRPVLDGDPSKPDMKFDVNYHEGAAVGYKWFDLKGHKPLFPFGHGLSYTEFGYSGLKADMRNGQLEVRFSVVNKGKVKGKDVPQVYIAPVGAQWEAPKRLAAWSKVDLAAGAKREVSVTVEPRVLATFDETARNWRVAGGKYKLILAQDAADAGTSITIDVPESRLDMQGKPVK